MLAVLSVCFGLLVAFGLGEIILRLMAIGYGNAPLVSDPYLHHVHPLNYRFVSHTPSGEYGGHEVYYDEQGRVSNPVVSDRNDASVRPKMAFMGDSFTEAGQVAFADSFVGIMATKLEGRVDVRNYGVSSYSPILYLLQWRKIVRNYRPDHVIVLLYSNDIADDRQRTRAAEFSTDGQLLALPGPSGGWLTSMLRKLYLARFLRKVQLQLKWMIENQATEKSITAGLVEENPEISDLSSHYMESLSKEISAVDGDLTIMVVPSKYRLSHSGLVSNKPQFSDKWKSWAAQRSINFIDLVKGFSQAAAQGEKLFFEKDIHYNENGHSAVAKALQSHFSELFSGVKSPKMQ